MTSSTPPPLLDSEERAAVLAPLERASTLPARCYTDPEVYERETHVLFRGGWLCAGRVDQVPDPGDYLSVDLLGEPLLVARDRSGTLRVLSRVCLHRAADLVTGNGNARVLQCPYHAWSYELDGRLRSAPLMDGAGGFDPASCRLPEIRSEVWEGWIFVNLDGRAEPLGPQLEPLTRTLTGYDMSRMVATETATFDSPFNWKVLVDNFMEAYHHIAIHRDTLQPLFPARDSSVPDNEGPYSVLDMPSVDPEVPKLVAAVVFPFHLFAPVPGALAWYQLLPETHDRFTLRIYTCFDPETVADPAQAAAMEEQHALTRTVHNQDIEACERVWRGLTSGHARQGRLSPLEKSIWQTARWWIERMEAPGR